MDLDDESMEDLSYSSAKTSVDTIDKKGTSNKQDLKEKEPTKTDTEAGKTDKDKPRDKKRRKKKSDEESKSATALLKNVLAASSFKVPDLSRDIDDKFYSASDYKETVKDIMDKIEYKSIVGHGKDGDDFDLDISVLPNKFEGNIQVSPMAWLDMQCIHGKPAQRRRRSKKQKKEKGKDKKRSNEPDTSKDKSAIDD